MNGLTPKELKTLSRQRLSSAAFSPKKLTLWYSGIVVGLNLLAILLNQITGTMIDNTGGLSGLGTRAILDTVSTVFSLVVQIATPLLSMGFLHCCIRFARQTDVQPKDLTMGPRRWAVILRHGLLSGGIFLAIGYLALQIASIVFMFLPSSEKAMELTYEMMENPALLEGNIPTEQLLEMLKAFLPVYIIAAVLFIAAFIPVSYRLRLSTYRILEDSPVGAVKAVLGSVKLMKGNCMALFKLDLSFFWFYLLQTVLSFLMAAIPMLFKLTDLWYIVLCVVYSGFTLLLEYCCLAYVQTAYAVFYDSILQKATTAELPKIEG